MTDASEQKLADWTNPDVQIVYKLLCSEASPTPEQHWEGWVARRIVAELAHAHPQAIACAEVVGEGE